MLLKLRKEGIILEPKEDSILNYPSYEDYINTLRSNRKVALCRCHALLELLRLFRQMPVNLNIEDELTFLNKKIFQIDTIKDDELSGDSNLSSLRKRFYLHEENELIEFFQLGKEVNKLRKDTASSGIKTLIGTTIYFYSRMAFSPKSDDDFKSIAKEYHEFLNKYELWLISNKRISVEETNVSPSITTLDVLESMRNKIQKDKIDLTNFLWVLYGLFSKEIYEPSLNRNDSAISSEIDALQQTLKIIKPKLDEIQTILYVIFLNDLNGYIPKKYKNRINDLREYMLKKEGCYIATLCYESYNCEQVIVFRYFRDHYLLKNKFCKILVSLYYKSSQIIIKKYQIRNSYTK